MLLQPIIIEQLCQNNGWTCWLTSNTVLNNPPIPEHTQLRPAHIPLSRCDLEQEGFRLVRVFISYSGKPAFFGGRGCTLELTERGPLIRETFLFVLHCHERACLFGKLAVVKETHIPQSAVHVNCFIPPTLFLLSLLATVTSGDSLTCLIFFFPKPMSVSLRLSLSVCPVPVFPGWCLSVLDSSYPSWPSPLIHLQRLWNSCLAK